MSGGIVYAVIVWCRNDSNSTVGMIVTAKWLCPGLSEGHTRTYGSTRVLFPGPYSEVSAYSGGLRSRDPGCMCREPLCGASMAALITGASFREDSNERLMGRSGNSAMERWVWERTGESGEGWKEANTDSTDWGVMCCSAQRPYIQALFTNRSNY